MLDKFLEEVVVLVVGKQAEPIADLLNTKAHVNEFIIAKKLNITINQTRNILYKLSDFGLVSSIRKKDRKKGWYTYFWKIEILHALLFLKNEISKTIEQIHHQINSREKKQFYVCNRCNIEVTEETALLYDFTCNECGEIFTLKDNTKVLKDFRKDLERLNKKLELVQAEISKIEEKHEKERAKIAAKIEREKKKIREKAAKARAKARAALKKPDKKGSKEKGKLKKLKKSSSKKLKKVSKFNKKRKR